MTNKRRHKTIILYTPEEVADRLRVSIYTVRRWIRSGELPAYKIGRAWRIGEIELTKWLETHREHH